MWSSTVVYDTRAPTNQRLPPPPLGGTCHTPFVWPSCVPMACATPVECKSDPLSLRDSGSSQAPSTVLLSTELFHRPWTRNYWNGPRPHCCRHSGGKRACPRHTADGPPVKGTFVCPPLVVTWGVRRERRRSSPSLPCVSNSRPATSGNTFRGAALGFLRLSVASGSWHSVHTSPSRFSTVTHLHR